MPSGFVRAHGPRRGVPGAPAVLRVERVGAKAATRPRRRSRAASACRPPGCTATAGCRPAETRPRRPSAVRRRNAAPGNSRVRSRSKRSRRSSTSCGTPRSSSRIETASGDSENRCRLMSECADAVPVSTGPTSRGSKSAMRRIACERGAAQRRDLRSRGGHRKTGVAARSARPRSRCCAAGSTRR